jgi:hypothetical protein
MPEGVEEIEYFHIELETHEVIFAEGAAAETSPPHFNPSQHLLSL